MKNILSKLWLSITAMVMLILIVIWWFNISLLDKFYLQDRINRLYEKGEAIAQMLEDSDLERLKSLKMKALPVKPMLRPVDDTLRIRSSAGNVPGIPPDIKNGAVNPDTFYYVDLNNRAVLYKSLSLLLKRPVESIDEIHKINTSLNRGEKFSQKLSSESEKRFHTIVVGVPVQKNGKTVGYLIFFSLAKIINETTAILKKQFALIALISIAVSSLFAFMLAKYFAKPLLLIKSVSDSISKGRYGMQVSVKNNDEIGLLAKSINRMSRELAKIEGLRRDFIANVTHEFKTPLSVIKTYSEMIRDIDIDDKESISYDAGIILDETERLNSMVSDMIYLSNIQSDNSSLSLEKINVCDIFRDIMDRSINAASAAGISLVKECADPVFITADREKITRCLMNFTVNSINHTPSGKRIYLRAAQNNDGSVRISVQDEGCGISESDVAYIWERFYKVDKARKSGPKGTGLGMSISKDILDMHGFKYGVSSCEGEGTIVYFNTKPVQ